MVFKDLCNKKNLKMYFRKKILILKHFSQYYTQRIFLNDEFSKWRNFFRPILRFRDVQWLRNPSWRIRRRFDDSGDPESPVQLRGQPAEVRNGEDPREVGLPHQARREDQVLEEKIFCPQKWNSLLLEVSSKFLIYCIITDLQKKSKLRKTNKMIIS